MVSNTEQPHEEHHEDRPHDGYGGYSRDNRWFAPGDAVSLVPRRPGVVAGSVSSSAASSVDGSATWEQGIVVEIFDDARAPLVYVRFPGGDSRWVFSEDLRHTRSPETV